MVEEPDLERLVEAATAAHDAAKVLGLSDVEAVLRIVLHILAKTIAEDDLARDGNGGSH